MQSPNLRKKKAAILFFALTASIALGGMVLAIVSHSASPDLIVTATVTNASTGKPIAGARVVDKGYGKEPRRGATTGADGTCSYATWPEEHNVEASAPGYKTAMTTMTTNWTQKKKTLHFSLAREQEK